jgi:hypothetical protein
MIQELIVLAIIAATAGIVAWSVVKKLRAKSTGACSGCSGCPSPCELKDLADTAKKTGG